MSGVELHKISMAVHSALGKLEAAQEAANHDDQTLFINHSVDSAIGDLVFCLGELNENDTG